MCTDVEMRAPATLEDAMALARSYERRLQITTDVARGPARPAKTVATPSPTPPTASTQAKSGAPSARPRRLSPEEIAQRRLEGLCFNCPAKFSKEHLKQCPMRGIYIMDMEEDADSSLDSDGAPEVSIHAMTGITTGDTMLLSTTVSQTPFIALVDSGSTHCFMSTTTAGHLGLRPTPRPGLSVGVANGERVPSAGVCPNTLISIAGEDFYIDIFIIPLAGYELVLGCQWLRTLGPELWDFKLKTMMSWRDDHCVRWQGRRHHLAAHVVVPSDGGSTGSPTLGIQRSLR